MKVNKKSRPQFAKEWPSNLYLFSSKFPIHPKVQVLTNNVTEKSHSWTAFLELQNLGPPLLTLFGGQNDFISSKVK